MKEMVNNKWTAVVITLFVIFLSIGMGGARSLSKMRTAVENQFYAGADNDGLSIENDLKQRLDVSIKFVQRANKYIPDSGASKDLLAAREALVNAKTAKEKFLANQKLQDASEVLYNQIKDLNIDEKDFTDCKGYYQDLVSANLIINREAADYNKQVNAFNEELEKAFFVRIFGFVKPLDIFG